EQSVTDLEELKAETAGQEYDNKKGKRKTQGVFYTPAWVTQYIAEVAIGGYLNKKEAELRDRFGLNSFSAQSTNTQRKTEIKFWETYRDEVLKKTRVIDPACGSGAFLIAAFDYLILQYERVNQALIALGHISKQPSSIDLDRTILSNNLYGVDLLSESVEITKLSLWLKTAAKGKTLTYLDNNIKVGNSIVDDSNVVDRAFNWQAEFPKIFAEGGFDVVIGNPPYVRQKLFSALKPYLQKSYKSYHGMADLYTYFYEKGLNILKLGGMLSYIVTNKWLKSGYGEPLRKFFAYQSVFEQIIDFGHAPIFDDADTFPCIVTIKKAVEDIDENIVPEIIVKPEPSSSVTICSVPRNKLANINLAQYLKENSSKINWSRFTANAWSLENTEIEELMSKIQQIGINLKDFAGIKPYWGILTGCNEVFLIDEATKNSLVKADPKSSEVIKPYLRGQDIKRWHPEWDNRWMIFTRRGIDIDKYPAIKSYLNNYRQQLEPRPKQWDEIKDGKWMGRKKGNYKWYEIQDTIDYWELFDQPKIIYQEIQFHPSYSYDENCYLTNNKAFILPKADLYILAVLNSPLIWWHNWRYLPHMKDEALNPAGYLMETIPIAPPTDEIRTEVEEIVSRLIEITKINRSAYQDVLEWLQITYNIEKLGQKLENFANLELNELVDEVRKRMRKTKSSDPLSPATLKALKEAYNEYAPAIQIRRAEAIKLEHRLSDLVNQAYKLTPEEIDLMWKTAPTRMPISLK
ncbi:MAG: DNA methyltransferase, partial [Crinalium sp.]